MHCKEVEKQLSAYLDQELDQQTAREVEEHLASCSDCKKTLSSSLPNVLNKKQLMHRMPGLTLLSLLQMLIS